MRMEYINYGIDLGTTNSCVARADGIEVRVFQNNDQMNVTPSAVHVLRTGRLIVGKRAYNAIVEDPDNVALQFKRWMGQRDTIRFPASGRTMNAEELSAEVLKSLHEDVRRQTGDDVQAAVITVPAAFGTLQCEATGRAAHLAGIEQFYLLQEPIAAAVAYGLTPGARDQRWLVFDLGGGTLDIAVISTRDRRLTVVEHGGKNLFGGKDIDRQIMQTFFLSALSETFALPDPKREPALYQRLLRRLTLKAEQEKIALSSSPEVLVDFAELGEDQKGAPYDLQLTLTREALDQEIEPFVDEAINLAEEVLSRARIAGEDLDRILLVGGPTQMPVIRSALKERIGAKVDYSQDPMTVVARGAAVFATTLEREVASVPIPSPGKAVLHLSYDRISTDLQCPVAGKIDPGSDLEVYEVKIDAEGGYWTSGWIPFPAGGIFEIPVRLRGDVKETRFVLAGRSRSGRLVDLEPNSFTVLHLPLKPSAPPLPSTICLELQRPDGTTVLEPIFRRNTPLPAETTVTRPASRTLRPGEPDTSLAIKLWEGEDFDVPRANLWLRNLYIRSDDVGRIIPEGSPIELTIRIDPSRLITVNMFIPRLNKHLTLEEYIPDAIETPGESGVSESDEFDELLERLDRLQQRLLNEGGETSTWEETKQLRSEIWELDEALHTHSDMRETLDPDWKARIAERLREIRARLYQLEKEPTNNRAQTELEMEARRVEAAAQAIVDEHPSDVDKREIEFLRQDLNSSLAKGDERGIKKATQGLVSLQGRVLFQLPKTWRELFVELRGCKFVNQPEAQRWLVEGEKAIAEDDLNKLQEAVRRLLKLLPPSQAEKVREQALPPGLRTLI